MSVLESKVSMPERSLSRAELVERRNTERVKDTPLYISQSIEILARIRLIGAYFQLPFREMVDLRRDMIWIKITSTHWVDIVPSHLD